MDRIQIRRPEDLGLAVSEARRLHGLTQAQLAEQSGVDRTYLAKLESGLSTLLLERVLRLLRRLNARPRLRPTTAMRVNGCDVLADVTKNDLVQEARRWGMAPHRAAAGVADVGERLRVAAAGLPERPGLPL